MSAPTWRKRPEDWLDVRGRGLGMWAYVLNRVSGLGLVAYLYLHLAVLSLLAQGPAAWTISWRSRGRTSFWHGRAAAGGEPIHGLNGLRVALVGLGIAVRAQRVLFVALMLLAAVLVAGAAGVFRK